MLESPSPVIPAACIERLSVTEVRYLGGRVNSHWLVDARGRERVLTAYRVALESLAYELEVLRRLSALGWPVPELVDEPLALDDRIWCLFTFLPGASVSERPSERRRRGRLLAELHESSTSLVDMGQRIGFCKADELVQSSALLQAVERYERLRPVPGRVLRWHLEQAAALFAEVETAQADLVVLHSDFAPWNLLFQDAKLSGVVDFEGTHLNYRVSDFALAWRGYQDDVIVGYEEVRPLTRTDRQLLVPAYWAWLLLGLEGEIGRMTSGAAPLNDLDWQVTHFLRRSKFHEGVPVYRP